MATRSDGWTNLVTGLGDALRDKRMAATPSGNFLRQGEAELLWRADDMAARAIEKIPQDALRRGFKFSVKPNAGEEEERDQAEDDRSIDGRTVTEWANELPGPMAEQRVLGPGSMVRPSRNDDAGWTKKVIGALIMRGLATYDGTGRLVRVDAAPVDPTLATSGQGDVDDAKEQQELVNARLKRLKAKQVLADACKYERAYGGAAIFLGTVDNSPGRSANILARPLDLNRVKELKFLTVLSPMELAPYRYYGDPLAPNYGEVQLWSLVPKSKGINPRPSVIRVHTSRLIIFNGIRTSRFMVEVQRGFGDSILNRMVQHIRNFSTSYESAAVLVHDFSQAIYKMKGLVELLQSDSDGLIQKRARAMDYARSVLRAVLIDSDEEFERKQTPVTGLPDLLDRMAKRLAAATGMPVSMLMGDEPAGLNATGQANRDWYNENVEVLQQERIIPALERITDVELHATEGVTGGQVPDGWSITMPPLEMPSEKEKSENRLKDAQAMALMIDRGVVHPEEVASSMYGGEEYSNEIKLNDEVRQAALEVQQVQEERAADMHAQGMESGAAGIQQTAAQTKAIGKKPPPGKKK